MATVSLPIFPNSLSLQVDATDGGSFLATLDDHIIKPKEDNTIDVTPKLSSLECFREQARQTKSIAEKLDDVADKLDNVADKLDDATEKLDHVVERLARLEQRYSCASEVLSKVQLYKIIGQGMVPFV